MKVTKTNSALKLAPNIYPGKFGGIPSTGSRDIMGTRICHADVDTDADSNEIRTETNMSPSLLVGDIKTLKSLNPEPTGIMLKT